METIPSTTGFKIPSNTSEKIFHETKKDFADHVNSIVCKKPKLHECTKDALTLLFMSRSGEDVRVLSDYWKEESFEAGQRIDDCIYSLGYQNLNSDEEIVIASKAICSSCRKHLLRYVETVLNYHSFGTFAETMTINFSEELLEKIVFSEMKHRKLFGYHYIPR